ncbi:P-loop containing nucleoside triphosphate hydrolase protein [Ustulina deusta]|nr:P-loop containing nucleoside triphosphate hydrolase protein [Ustulina deusta]
MDTGNNHDLLGSVETIRQIINDPIYASRAFRPESGSLHKQDTDASEKQIRDSHRRKIKKPKKRRTRASTRDRTDDNKDSSTLPSSRSSSRSRSQISESRELEEKEKIGWKAEVLHLYASQKSDNGIFVFSSLVPAQVKLRERENESLNKGLRAAPAILFNHIFNGRTVTGHSIEIRNKWLRQSLSKIFESYPGIQLDAPSLIFSHPFEAFVHRWDRLLAEEENEKDHEGKELLKVLREAILAELQDSFQALRDFQATGYINYHHLLLTFNPGDIIVRSKQGVLSAGILNKAQKCQTRFREYVNLEINVVDWDGDIQGFRQVQWTIDAFEGLRQISEDTVFPLEAHREKKRIQTQLVERGKLFAGVCGRHMKTFKGRVKRAHDSDRRWRRTSEVDNTIYLSETIIVDAKAYHRFHKSTSSLVPLDGSQRSAIHMLQEAHDRYASKRTQKLSFSLNETKMMLTVTKVKGFALNSKTWHKFNISGINSFNWNQEAFHNLVLDEGEKGLLSALISYDRSSSEGFDDFVQGKGKGLILLLGGPPGVGKTLTAEAVAGKLKRPLYRVNAGDLGSSVSEVEESLKRALELSAYWNAVLLIDEADVFMGQRSDVELSRNELVSLFLVLLEYYEGVLILTTNRTEGLDPAFESRIDIVLRYKPLTRDARREIWSRFIRRLPSDNVDLGEQDIDSLAEWPLNGRQIKSAIKTARILATHGNMPLRMHHLDIVLKIRTRGAELLRTGEEQRKALELTASNYWILSQQFGWFVVLGTMMVAFLAYWVS